MLTHPDRAAEAKAALAESQPGLPFNRIHLAVTSIPGRHSLVAVLSALPLPCDLVVDLHAYVREF